MLCHVFIWWAPLISSAGDGERDWLWPCYGVSEAEMDSRLFVHLLVPYALSFSVRRCLSRD